MPKTSIHDEWQLHWCVHKLIWTINRSIIERKNILDAKNASKKSKMTKIFDSIANLRKRFAIDFCDKVDKSIHSINQFTDSYVYDDKFCEREINLSNWQLQSECWDSWQTAARVISTISFTARKFHESSLSHAAQCVHHRSSIDHLQIINISNNHPIKQSSYHCQSMRYLCLTTAQLCWWAQHWEQVSHELVIIQMMCYHVNTTSVT